MMGTMQPALSGDGSTRDFSVVARVNVTVAAILVAVLMALGVIVWESDSVSAHPYNSYNSVDGNEQINYYSYSRYTSYLSQGAGAWNYLDWWFYYEGVYISPDNQYTTVDLNIVDMYDSYRDNYASWQPQYATDRIAYNVANFDALYPYWKKWASVHELGHAHAFKHPDGYGCNSSYANGYGAESIMVGGLCSEIPNYPVNHDYNDYDYWWAYV